MSEPAGWTCTACGEWIENDPAKPLSGCKKHKSRVHWAPHRLGADWEQPENWEGPMTTKEMIAARRASGDTLVTKSGGFSFSTTSGDGIKGFKLGCCRFEPHASRIIERDTRDGECFPTREDAEVYGYEAGHLIWFSDWKALRTQAVR